MDIFKYLLQKTMYNLILSFINKLPGCEQEKQGIAIRAFILQALKRKLRADFQEKFLVLLLDRSLSPLIKAMEIEQFENVQIVTDFYEKYFPE